MGRDTHLNLCRLDGNREETKMSIEKGISARNVEEKRREGDWFYFPRGCGLIF